MIPLVQNNVLDCVKNGELIIIIDDVDTQTSYLMGLAEKVTAQNVNFMAKIGKGLVYVCIDGERASYLNLPLMSSQNNGKKFTVSIDYKTTTTGISAFERADTIKAMTDLKTKPDDFKRPGHVFPLIFFKNGILDHIGIAEATAEITRKAECSSDISYLCEILNKDGEVATQFETMEISEEYNIPCVSISDLFKAKRADYICRFEGSIAHGQGLGRKLGYPTANLQSITQEHNLKNGVYGVKVIYQNVEYYGVMNTGVKPTFNNPCQEKSHEIFIFNFNQMIYSENLTVEVKFFIREEKQFTSIYHLISQMGNDIKEVKTKFGLLERVEIGLS
ncbi:3,4-dihydroxy-2-butanone-4-phosphate synthase [Alkalihalobacillus deserti]|uniref:3,4-dihydroxy-2-butanone-4-phosphate synthase n=1 Tax=Alkalihalobacillus deserti TaxID=2879466 RepID=UPI001D151CAE|nr:3,4-dihydroxy-2-butanone-4-phosphate synthase [Alkalihalobacillus deserti]